MKVTIQKNIKVDFEQIMSLMRETYWAKDRPEEVMRTAVEHSDVYYAIDEESGKAVGMARVISDYATNYYLCDVIVTESLRGQGIGKMIIEYLVNDPSINALRGILLTGDAHGFYESLGFIRNTERVMQRPRGTTMAPDMTTDITNFEVIRFRKNVHMEQVMTLMKESYWGNQRSLETVTNSIKHSECFCAVTKDEGKLIGMARVITDHATNYYLCDVIVDENYRHHGIGKNIINAIVTDPELGPLRGILLTRDAHGFYEKFGFVRETEKGMERPRADQKAAEAAAQAYQEHRL